MDQFSENYNDQLSEAEKLILQNEDDAQLKENFATFSKEQIVSHAQSLLHTTNVKQAYETLQELRKAFEYLLDQERPLLIKEWVASGNDPKDFISPQDDQKVKLFEVVQKFKEMREVERKRAEEEKLINLNKKQAILDKIVALVDSEENESSLNDLRDLMRQWKEIRQIPKEHQEALYSKYKFYLDKYYDNLSKFNELKDLDREKNLEIKIELIKRAEALKDEKNIRKAMISLNKIHDDWKNTGPVRKEISDEIWTRFKAASDLVIDVQKAHQSEVDAQRQQNLEKKILLVEKAETAITALPSSNKEWNKMAEEIDAMLEDWKKIGPVPSERNEEIWTRFQGARNAFYSERKTFFKKIQFDRKDNLTKKIALCEQAEKLQEANEFMKTSEQFQALQDQWKVIGPVPEEQNEIIWKRFRASFDHFYERKNKWFAERKTQESGAVTAKEAIIAELDNLSKNPDNKINFNDLKAIQNKWNDSGFVSGKKFQSLNKQYQSLMDGLYQGLRNNSNAERETMVKENLNSISASPDAKYKLQSEEKRLRDLMKKIQDELSTIENNKGFFQHSKNAEAMLKQFDDKIKKSKEQLEKLQKELQLVIQAKKANA